jgi:hypothetical protein
MSELGSTNFAQQYYYVILTLCLGIVGICIFNIIAYIYFSRRKPVDVGKFFSDLGNNEAEPIRVNSAQKFDMGDGKYPIRSNTSQYKF